MVLLMKKLLGIVVLGLLLNGNAYANFITMKNCYDTHWESWSYVKDKFYEIESTWSINLNNNNIKYIHIYMSNPSSTAKEINSVWDYTAYDYTEEFIFGYLNGASEVRIKIDLKRKKVFHDFGDGKSMIYQCDDNAVSSNKKSGDSVIKKLLKKLY